MLYQIQYFGAAFDNSRRNPISDAETMAYAQRSDGTYVVPDGTGGWRAVEREYALSRNPRRTVNYRQSEIRKPIGR